MKNSPRISIMLPSLPHKLAFASESLRKRTTYSHRLAITLSRIEKKEKFYIYVSISCVSDSDCGREYRKTACGKNGNCIKL